MIANILLAIISGAALGIAIYCIRGLSEVRNIRDIYESYIIDLIEELNEYRDEDSNNYC